MFKNKILSTLLLSAVLLTSFSYSIKAESKDPAEAKLQKIIKSFGSENIQLEDGILLKVNEQMNVSNLKNLKISDPKIAQVKNDVLTGQQEGTTFISYTSNDAVHIKEVSVASSETLAKSNLNKTESKPSSRSYYKVSIDPGHGGSDPGTGAVYVNNELIEKELNLTTSLLVADILESYGVEVEFTRTDDSYVTLLDRIQMINSYAPDAAVSIHYNSSTNKDAYGIETYYTGPKLNKELASDIQIALCSTTGANDRGVKTENFTVIQKTNCTSALVEGGFISNEKEANNITDLTYKQKIAEGIAKGIMQFLKDNVTLQ